MRKVGFDRTATMSVPGLSRLPSLLPRLGARSIAISDTGTGIATADLPHIFDHFYRAEKSCDRKRGAGIGLAIVKQLVEIHGGYVDVESEPGVGSSFYVYLPVGNFNEKM